MYTELKERLQRVGISTILCWADKTSEGFWFKQVIEDSIPGEASNSVSCSLLVQVCFGNMQIFMMNLYMQLRKRAYHFQYG